MHVQLAFGCLKGRGSLVEAEQEFASGREADREVGHDQGIATAVESLGLRCLDRAEYDRAAELLVEAKAVAGRVGDVRRPDLSSGSVHVHDP